MVAPYVVGDLVVEGGVRLHPGEHREHARVRRDAEVLHDDSDRSGVVGSANGAQLSRPMGGGHVARIDATGGVTERLVSSTTPSRAVLGGTLSSSTARLV